MKGQYSQNHDEALAGQISAAEKEKLNLQKSQTNLQKSLLNLNNDLAKITSKLETNARTTEEKKAELETLQK
jgi:peptidoglycan hydrolase CwlO-like protein